MPTYYSLAEAARVLGMSPDQLKHEAQLGKIHFYRDGSTMRFRADLIDEEARRRGLGSDPSLPLSDLELGAADAFGTGTDLDISDFQLSVADEPGPKSGTSSDADILIDEASLAPEGSSSSTIIGMKPSGKQPSDSDVKVVPDSAPKSASDSDVRLAQPSRRLPSDSDVTLVSDESSEFSSDSIEAFPAADPNATILRKSPLGESSDDVPAVGGGAKMESDSDFELSPSSVIDALQPDSGSDFELTALESSSDEISTSMKPRRPSDSDVTGAGKGATGVRLDRPSDSGINLAGDDFNLSSDSIELAPMDDTGRGGSPLSQPMDPGATALPIRGSADPGATALPIKPKGEKDLFEDTDFEVDALEENSDETMQLDAASDFELDEAESASEVFAIDEEAIDESAATAMRPAKLDVDSGSSEGISGETDTAWADLEGEVAAPSGAGAPSPSAAPSVPSPALGSRSMGEAEWGTGWVVGLGIATVLMLFLTFVNLDLVKNLYEFRGDGPASGLVKSISGLMGE